MATTTQTNIKKLLLPITLAKAGWVIVEASRMSGACHDSLRLAISEDFVLA